MGVTPKGKARNETPEVVMVLPKVDVDFAGALSKIRTDQPLFPTKTKALSIRKGFDVLNARKRARAKRFIRPENAIAIIDALPLEEGDRLHAITGGDFVFGSLFDQITRQTPAVRVLLSTLSAFADGELFEFHREWIDQAFRS